MPVTPSGSLRDPLKVSEEEKSVKTTKETEPKTIKKKSLANNVFIYAFLGVILTEYASVIIWNYSSNKYYADFWYPILGNLIVMLLILPNLINARKLKFCLAKKLAFWSLFGYYAMNILTIIFNCQDVLYRTLVNNLFLGLAFSMSVLTIIKNEK